MEEFVYHFTDSGRLPWIIADGYLAAGRNNSGNYPDPDFLWATSDIRGSMSATWSKEGYKTGITCLVRITLRASDFEPWLEVAKRCPNWTEADIKRLILTAGRDSPSAWVARTEQLPQSEWISIHTKAYKDEWWRPWAGGALVTDDETLTIQIGADWYTSKRLGANKALGHPMAYAVSRRPVMEVK
jgi:hypothetical protein